jgi:hypothetical protein
MVEWVGGAFDRSFWLTEVRGGAGWIFYMVPGMGTREKRNYSHWDLWIGRLPTKGWLPIASVTKAIDRGCRADPIFDASARFLPRAEPLSVSACATKSPVMGVQNSPPSLLKRGV